MPTEPAKRTRHSRSNHDGHSRVAVSRSARHVARGRSAPTASTNGRVKTKPARAAEPARKHVPEPSRHEDRHLVIITGLSGSGKGSVLNAFEDSGYYCVDNLPVDLLPKFVDLVQHSSEIARAALVIDIREGGQRLDNLPHVVHDLRRMPLRLTLLFLEASDEALMRRFSETRRPHPLATDRTVPEGIQAERQALAKIRETADLVVDTSKFNVHELRAFITDRVVSAVTDRALRIGITSFGFRNGIPPESDLVFDVRFLPNPNYIPAFRRKTGRDPKVAEYIRSFPQTQEFIRRISELLDYLIPHYGREGKSYLTIAFGCTGGQHRSVMIAEAVNNFLRSAGYRTRLTHRDMPHEAAVAS